MPKQIVNLPVNLLEADPQRRGDLFCRLLADLFHSLGYADLLFDVQKAGREVDILGRHRTESRRLVAEAKALARPLGGAAVNKFVGSLDAERRQHGKAETSGYIVSLAGFTATARQQEEDAGGGRVVLLGGEDLIGELIRSRVVPSPEAAAVVAGRLAQATDESAQLDRRPVLLGHATGWLWAVVFRRSAGQGMVVLIHADGEPIGGELADQILTADRTYQHVLADLELVRPIPTGPTDEELDAANECYSRYLSHHCGLIQFDGLPADGDLASRSVLLEELFVPLRLVRIKNKEGHGAHSTVSRQAIRRAMTTHEWKAIERYSFYRPISEITGPHEIKGKPIGKVLQDIAHLAILAPPGSGKTTLLKRLATAYSTPIRRVLVADDLPDAPWFPVFVRCRQIGDLARRPLRQVLFEIPTLGDFQEHEAAFRVLVQEKLRSGEALVLLDGLDEIGVEGDRRLFAEGVRAFLATYPQVSLVLTSREPGFRVAAGALEGTCARYALVELGADEIARFVQAWYQKAVGKEGQVRARSLTANILGNDRIRALAASPLLLTTLLLVERWLGELPTRRSVLYHEAIDVLLRTWNAQAHEPMALDEAVPQLAYLAFVMMRRSIQQISQPQLREVLREARKQMEDLLGRARVPISEFVQRIELRSSLLVEAGFIEERGTVVPVYEFRHLTFQEYLAAVAVAERYLPNPDADAPLSAILAPHLLDEAWLEVIPLAAILADRRDTPVIIRDLAARAEAETAPRSLVASEIDEEFQARWTGLLDSNFAELLTESSEHVVSRNQQGGKARIQAAHIYAELLAQCLADEVKVGPELIRRSLGAILATCDSSPRGPIGMLGRSVYGEDLRGLLFEELSQPTQEYRRLFFLLAAATPSPRGSDEARIEDLIAALTAGEWRDRLLALAACYGLAAGPWSNAPGIAHARLLAKGIATCGNDGNAAVFVALAIVSRAWADAGWLAPEVMPYLLPTIARAWHSTWPFGSVDDCVEAIVRAPLVTPGSPGCEPGDRQLSDFLRREAKNGGKRAWAARIAAYSLGESWGLTVLRNHLEEVPDFETSLPHSMYRYPSPPLSERLRAALEPGREADAPRRRTLPMIPVRGRVIFPRMYGSFTAGRTGSVNAIREAWAGEREICCVAQRNERIDSPTADDLLTTGIVANLTQMLVLYGGNIQVLVRGLYRVRLVRFLSGETYRAEVEPIADKEDASEPTGVRSAVEDAYEHYARKDQDFGIAPLSVLTLDDPISIVLGIVNTISAPALSQAVMETEGTWQQWEVVRRWLEEQLRNPTNIADEG